MLARHRAVPLSRFRSFAAAVLFACGLFARVLCIAASGIALLAWLSYYVSCRWGMDKRDGACPVFDLLGRARSSAFLRPPLRRMYSGYRVFFRSFHFPGACRLSFDASRPVRLLIHGGRGVAFFHAYHLCDELAKTALAVLMPIQSAYVLPPHGSLVPSVLVPLRCVVCLSCSCLLVSSMMSCRHCILGRLCLPTSWIHASSSVNPAVSFLCLPASSISSRPSYRLSSPSLPASRVGWRGDVVSAGGCDLLSLSARCGIGSMACRSACLVMSAMWCAAAGRLVSSRLGCVRPWGAVCRFFLRALLGFVPFPLVVPLLAISPSRSLAPPPRVDRRGAVSACSRLVACYRSCRAHGVRGDGAGLLGHDVAVAEAWDEMMSEPPAACSISLSPLSLGLVVG